MNLEKFTLNIVWKLSGGYYVIKTFSPVSDLINCIKKIDTEEGSKLFVLFKQLNSIPAHLKKSNTKKQ